MNIINSNVMLAPMVANSFAQCGPDCLKLLWLAADRAAQTQYCFSLDEVNNNCLNEHIIDSQQAIDYQRIRGGKYHENSLCLFTCIFEAIDERILGVTRVLLNSMGINSCLLKPDTISSLCALFMNYFQCLKHQIHFYGCWWTQYQRPCQLTQQ